MQATFETLEARYKTGKWTAADNVLSATVEAPRAGQIAHLPRPGMAEHRLLSERGRQALDKRELGLIILSGGMATRFGWDKPKGVFPVYLDRSFLGWKLTWARELCGKNVPIFIMTSFHTHDKVFQHLEENAYFGMDPGAVHLFQQYRFPRLTPDGTRFESPTEADAAPGHGDFVHAMRAGGLLTRFLADGGKTLLFSNVDNLGASPDLAIVGSHLQAGVKMTAEVAGKAAGDKGGAPALVNGKLQLVEGFAFPPAFDQDAIPVFNTATYCFDAQALDAEFDLPWYLVEKKVDGRPVIQFEHLAGDLSIFLESAFLEVDRDDRFIPVKSQADLLHAQSLIAAKAERLKLVSKIQRGHHAREGPDE